MSQQEVLQRIKKIVLSQEPSAKIYLYGSRARATGSTNSNSDWDLLILLNRNTIDLSTERKISYPLYDLEFEIGQVISPMVYSEKEWLSKFSVTPLYRNIVKDGICYE
jgi:predicted nucleotidyltransferase